MVPFGTTFFNMYDVTEVITFSYSADEICPPARRYQQFSADRYKKGGSSRTLQHLGLYPKSTESEKCFHNYSARPLRCKLGEFPLSFIYSRCDRNGAHIILIKLGCDKPCDKFSCKIINLVSVDKFVD